MKEREQRIAIATARGWHISENDPDYWWIVSPTGTRLTGFSKFGSKPTLVNLTDRAPRYTKDLNAIREACLWALDNLWDAEQTEVFTRALESRNSLNSFTYANGTLDAADAARIIIQATAEDWCYAFLKASGLWIENTTD